MKTFKLIRDYWDCFLGVPEVMDNAFCCGIRELNGIDEVDPELSLWVISELVVPHSMNYDDKGRCILFSSINGHGQKLADLIYEHGFGQITEPVVTRNGNSGNTVKAYLWGWTDAEHKRLRTWIKDNVTIKIINYDDTRCKYY